MCWFYVSKQLEREGSLFFQFPLFCDFLPAGTRQAPGRLPEGACQAPKLPLLTWEEQVQRNHLQHVTPLWLLGLISQPNLRKAGGAILTSLSAYPTCTIFWPWLSLPGKTYTGDAV